MKQGLTACSSAVDATRLSAACVQRLTMQSQMSGTSAWSAKAFETQMSPGHDIICDTAHTQADANAAQCVKHIHYNRRC